MTSTPYAASEPVGCTDEERDRFLADGFIRLDDMIEEAELERLSEIYEQCISGEPPEGVRHKPLGGYDEHGRSLAPQMLGVLKAFPEICEMNYYRRLEAAARKILGPDAFQQGGHMIYKPARYGAATPWHQDQGYHNPKYLYRNINCWLPLEGATVEGGCMQFVRGSHLGPIVPHDHLEPGNKKTALVAVGQDHWQANGTPVPCPRGSVTLHHSYVLHYAGPNVSDTPRRALIINFRIQPEPLAVPWRLNWQ